MFDYQPRLIGELLSLRPAQGDDWASLSAIGCDPQVWAGHPDRKRYIEQNFRKYFEDGLSSGRALVALSVTTNAVLGWSRYSDDFVEPGEIEIGWTFLGRAYWGGRYNAEMKRLMLQHAFRFVDRAIFRIGETNGRSRRAAEKIGARLMLGRAVSNTAGSVPYAWYGLDRADFERMKRLT